MTHERLKHEEEVFKLSWTSALVVGGGTVALLLGESSPLRSLFAFLGSAFTLTLLIFIVSKDNEIKQATREGRQ